FSAHSYSAPSPSTPLGSPGTTARFVTSHKASTRSLFLSVCPSLPTPWRMLAAPTRTFRITAASRKGMSVVAGWWTSSWVRSKPSSARSRSPTPVVPGAGPRWKEHDGGLRPGKPSTHLLHYRLLAPLPLLHDLRFGLALLTPRLQEVP